jgi:hypothetical protein
MPAISNQVQATQPPLTSQTDSSTEVNPLLLAREIALAFSSISENLKAAANVYMARVEALNRDINTANQLMADIKAFKDAHGTDTESDGFWASRDPYRSMETEEDALKNRVRDLTGSAQGNAWWGEYGLCIVYHHISNSEWNYNLTACEGYISKKNSEIESIMVQVEDSMGKANSYAEGAAKLQDDMAEMLAVLAGHLRPKAPS